MLETVRDRDREYVRMLEKLSMTDPLTHLYNRRYLVDMFMRLFNSAKRHDLIFALMLIDLDFFKPYNDTYGHPEGDKVLIRVAGGLTEVLRRGDDYAFRIGGEEFCCLVMAENSEQIRATAESVRSGIEALQISYRASPEGVMTASVGIWRGCSNVRTTPSIRRSRKDATAS
jgi:diguanylate cyclase (GGDEF)-like protein